jgi:hypothetical protein
VAYAIVCSVVVIVVTSLRFYVRFRLLRKFGIDDIALTATLVRAPIVLPRVNYVKDGRLTPVTSFPPSQVSL